MSQTLFLDTSQAGVFATQPVQAEFPILVAPTTSDSPDQFNTYRQPLLVVGCWGIPDAHFEFDSSFITPEFQPATEKFISLRGRLADPKTAQPAPISIFGHADPVGSDDYNKRLSGRRARAMFGLLTKNTSVWLQLYSNPEGGDNWQQNKVVNTMRDALTDAGNPNPPQTASQLFPLYMEFLAPGLKLGPDDFLAGLSGSDQKGDCQGCSEFNPVFLLSKQEEDAFNSDKSKESKDERDGLNAVNRRVLVFFFKPGTRVDPTKWPCPTWKQDSKGCVSRFWSNGDDRRNLRFTNARRELGKISEDEDTGLPVTGLTEDTFACRFYYGISLNSPCEPGAATFWPLTIQIPAHPPTLLAQARFVVTVGVESDAPVYRGRTGDDGTIFVPVLDEQTTITLLLDVRETLFGKFDDSNATTTKKQPADPDAFPDEDTFFRYTLAAGTLQKLAVGNQPATNNRLFNLGYGPDPLAKWNTDPAQNPPDSSRAVKSFQHDQKLQETGNADDATESKLQDVYGS